MEVLESNQVENQEKFHFLESDIIQLRTALKIQSEQSQLFERKLNNATTQNEQINKENKLLREGKYCTCKNYHKITENSVRHIMKCQTIRNMFF